MNQTSLRDTYLANTVATAGPGQMLVMLCDRLVLDISLAIEAFGADDIATIHDKLMHAQDILTHLSGSLDTSGTWDGAPALQGLYTWLERQLRAANSEKSVSKAVEALPVAAEIADMWRMAAQAVDTAVAAV